MYSDAQNHAPFSSTQGCCCGWALQRFRPMTVERPKVLLPLVNVPLINYTLDWLTASGVDEVLILAISAACCTEPCSYRPACADSTVPSIWLYGPAALDWLLNIQSCRLFCCRSWLVGKRREESY